MLQLRNIYKHYDVGDSTVRALDGVSIDFRECEFVSILGPSGCGKTTLLNIVGGLDRYSDGDLLINGKSTKKFKDSDWDTYRNHSIGFVFQSYNLIPHQTVLANVELALTLSGVSKSERRRRAIEALKKVGLGDQLKKKPNQMSGGQMQRVAIARAIVNDPDILLADEPTGALDTATSVQIMEILKEIAKDKLVVMVTHNPELAEQYSTRIVKLRDGRVIDDSMPFEAPKEKNEVVRKTAVKKGKRTSMSFVTALGLSLNNLMTKKGRTFMTSFAGSIGIIGIALILALSNGINAYIALVQEDTLSTYPLTIKAQTQDMSAMMGVMTSVSDNSDYRNSGKIHVDDSMGSLMSAMNQVQHNDLETFKKHIDAKYDELAPYISTIQYTYDFDLQVYNTNPAKNSKGEVVDRITQVNPTTIFDNMGEQFAGMTGLMDMSGMTFTAISEMLDNQDILNQQYEVVAGEWPKEANELVLVISRNNQISKMTLYMLGIYDQSEIEGILADLIQDGSNYDDTPMDPFEYDDFVGMTFRLLNTSDYYVTTDRTYTVDGKTYPIWRDKRVELDMDENQKKQFVLDHGIELKISGIIRPAEGTTATSISTNLAYTKELTEYILSENEKSAIINQQKEQPEYNVLTGEKFTRTEYGRENIGELIAKIDPSVMSQFYSVMRQMILSDPEYSSAFEVKDAEGLMGFYMMTPSNLQVNIMSAILKAAQANGGDLTMLLSVINGMNAQALPGVTLTADNLLTLLPILPQTSQMILLGGIDAETAGKFNIPMAIPGLIEMAGEEAMKPIYAVMSDQIRTIEITNEIFERLLPLLNDEQFATMEKTLYNMAIDVDATYDSVLSEFGDAEKAKPFSINFYAVDFESKDAIEAFIEDYNENIVTYLNEYKPDWRTSSSGKNQSNLETNTGAATDAESGKLPAAAEEHQIKYTDMVGLLMSSVTSIINAISYVLIAFVSISLVVSSIMIGIITYISVLERTKEIGILRAMGASKRDISRVFNAETLIIGLCAGLIGIIFTVLICIPISAIIQQLSGIPSIAAVLPFIGGVVLIAISTLLTVIAGLIPSRVAAKKDPVVALRTE